MENSTGSTRTTNIPRFQHKSSATTNNNTIHLNRPFQKQTSIEPEQLAYKPIQYSSSSDSDDGEAAEKMELAEINRFATAHPILSSSDSDESKKMDKVFARIEKFNEAHPIHPLMLRNQPVQKTGNKKIYKKYIIFGSSIDIFFSLSSTTI